jgi:hypothetical protein
VPSPGDSLGIGGGQVGVIALPADQALEGGPPVAWVSTVAQIPSPTAAHASEHDRVCDTLLAMGDDILPARFGQVFENDVALGTHYAQRMSSLRAVWRRIENALEISLALTLKDEMRDASVDPRSTHPAGHPGAQASSTGMGYAYLSGLAAPIRARRRLREQVEPFRMQLREAAGELIRDEVVHSQADPSATVLSHLVVRDKVSAYHNTVSRVEIAHPLIRVLLLGPHAPYSFVSPESGPPAGAGG